MSLVAIEKNKFLKLKTKSNNMFLLASEGEELKIYDRYVIGKLRMFRA